MPGVTMLRHSAEMPRRTVLTPLAAGATLGWALWFSCTWASLPPAIWSASWQHGGWVPRRQRPELPALEVPEYQSATCYYWSKQSQGQPRFKGEGRRAQHQREESAPTYSIQGILVSHIQRQPTTFCLKNFSRVSRVARMQCSHGFVIRRNFCLGLPLSFSSTFLPNIYISNGIAIGPREFLSENRQDRCLGESFDISGVWGFGSSAGVYAAQLL